MTTNCSIIVVDDFYDNPDQVRKAALASRFKTYSQGPYSYRSAKPKNYLVQDALERIIPIIGQDYRGKFIESQFIAETKQDEIRSKKKSWVHFDRSRWVGVLYLSLPQHCQGGTSFFLHKNTGFTRWEELLKYTLQGHGRPRDIFKDSTDLRKWDVISSIGMIYNRLLLFDSRMFHQATSYFGTNLSNCRLYHHFAFDEVTDEELSVTLSNSSLHTKKETNDG